MKFVSTTTFVFVLVVVVCSVLFVRSLRNDSQNDSPGAIVRPPQIQCAHWSILRTSQLLGVPVSVDYLLKNLPYRKKGHSMLQMSKVLKEIGFETEGRKETLNTLQSQTFPCIAHLTNPDHYVVVSAVDDKYVHIFDGDGRRIARDRVSFDKQWSGNVLFVRKPAIPTRLPAFLPKPNGDAPLADFDWLIRDLGTVPAVGEPVAFSYTVRNVGNAELVIKRIIPDCTCIENKKPDTPIKPGETGSIELLYHVQSQQGPFFHTVIVETNEPQVPVLALMASGWSGIDLRVEPHHIYLKEMVSEQEKKFRCFVKFTGAGQDLQIQIGETSLDGADLVKYILQPVTDEVIKDWFSEFSVKSSVYGQAYILDLTFLPFGNVGDTISGKIILDTNIKGHEKFTLNVSGWIAPPIRSFPQIISSHHLEESEIVLVSRTEDPFEIVSVFQEEHEFSWKKIDDPDCERTVSLFLDAPIRQISTDLPIKIKIKFPKSDKYYDLPIKVIP